MITNFRIKFILVMAVVSVVLCATISSAATVNLQLMTWAAPENIEPIVAAFEEDYPNVDVEIIYEGNATFFDKLKVLIAGGVAPDVFLLPYERVPEYASSGLLLDFTTISNNDDEFVSRKRDYQQFLLDGYTYQGRFYGMAWAFNPMCLYYNKNILDASGVPYPDKALSWDAFLDLAKKLTRKNGDTVTQWGFTWNWRWIEYIYQNGGGIIDATGNKSLFNSPNTVQALQFIHDMLYQYEVAPSPLLGLNGNTLFQEGDAAMHHDGGWKLRSYNDGAMRYDWGIGRLPKQVTEATLAFFDGHVAYAGTKYPNEAWNLVKYIAGPNGQEIVSKGNFLTVPVLRSIASKSIPVNQPVTEKLLARLAQTEVARIQPVHVKQTTLAEILAEVEQVFRNEASPAQVVENVHNKLSVLLAEN
ncbi:MAG TPA: sugar ABC transporter substrate-binding protein [Firmicutes bacterium]|nr:sugar ABC transporter substrate-binding protein [Bacillota bacterium]